MWFAPTPPPPPGDHRRVWNFHPVVKNSKRGKEGVYAHLRFGGGGGGGGGENWSQSNERALSTVLENQSVRKQKIIQWVADNTVKLVSGKRYSRREITGVFQNIDPPPRHRHASVYPPPLVRGEDTLAGKRGGGQ